MVEFKSFALIGRNWPSFSNIKHLVIFGDSYCDVGYYIKHSPHPTPENPLGVKYPGYTYAEPDKPNWVGHLVKKYNPNPSFLVVYDFALGGDRVSGVQRQLESQFSSVLAEKPDWAQWNAEDTLFVTWVGINDCAFVHSIRCNWFGIDPPELDRYGPDHEEDIRHLFEIQEELYKVGARNFLFIDVPPINRSPAASDVTRDKSFINWNTELGRAVHLFFSNHEDTSAMVYSSWDTFTRVLDDPTSHGFSNKDTSKAGGAIWVDRLHPTSRMHDIVAHDLAQFLNAQPAYNVSLADHDDPAS